MLLKCSLIKQKDGAALNTTNTRELATSTWLQIALWAQSDLGPNQKLAKKEKKNILSHTTLNKGSAYKEIVLSKFIETQTCLCLLLAYLK